MPVPRFLRLAAYIAVAQIAGILVLFSFGYAIAHASGGTQFSLTYDSGANTFTIQNCTSVIAAIRTAYGSAISDTGAMWTGTAASPEAGRSYTPTTDTLNPNGNYAVGYVWGWTSDANWCSTNATFANPFTSSDPSQTYYFVFSAVYAGGWHYFTPHVYAQITWNGTTPTPVNPVTDTSTRIVPLTPATASDFSTTTASTTVDFSAQYFYNEASSTDKYNKLELFLNETDHLAASSSVYDLNTLATSTLSTMDTPLVLPSGSSWNYNWCFGIPAPWGEISGTCSATQQVFVVSNPIIQQLGTTTTALGTYATSTCSIANVTGCFQNAIAYLFWPTQTDFYYFGQISGNIRTHVPFGYVYIAIGQVQSISGTSTPSFTLNNTASSTAPYINASIQTIYFDPIKNGIAAVLWALAVIWFLKRIRDLHL